MIFSKTFHRNSVYAHRLAVQLFVVRFKSVIFCDLIKQNERLIFISKPTNTQRINIKFILKLLRHVSVFLHHPKGAYKFRQLKL